MVAADFGKPFPKDVDRKWTSKLGGSALLDIGIYPVAQVTNFLGYNLEQTKCVGHLTGEKGFEVDALGNIALKYPDHKIGVINWNL